MQKHIDSVLHGASGGDLTAIHEEDLVGFQWFEAMCDDHACLCFGSFFNISSSIWLVTVSMLPLPRPE